ncbi:MAG: MOSC domain-containing protein [Gemmatimonadetes bacterium]|nr:MOSC domain-containing protein [Gemmatimonadota bacterium]
MVNASSQGRIVSLNVGVVEEIEWKDRVFRTAIRKRPVEGRRHVGPLGVQGDAQGNRRVHGGVDKALYGYAAEHHDFWEEVFGRPVVPGDFGENLTLAGLVEDDVRIGDRFRVGVVLLEVSEPRQPCSTFAAVHRRSDLPRIFADAGWPGIYFRVLEDGEVGPGDAVERVHRDPAGWTVRRVFDLVMGKAPLPEDLGELLALPTLAESTRAALVRRAESTTEEGGSTSA